MCQGNEERLQELMSTHRNRVATSIEVLSILVLIAGAFLYLQYNSLSSLCGGVSNSDPCWKSQVRSDMGMALMVVGGVGIATGAVVGWLRRRARKHQTDGP
ncbi:MAG TPA: hypothetical protein VED63_05775 [Acidimicrobiales bacterium]|nr:hypothetical protein [Acidimicrobiales bacterium]